MHLEWDDIDSKRKLLKLRSKVKRWGFRMKDFEERELPLSDEMLAMLKGLQSRPRGNLYIDLREGRVSPMDTCCGRSTSSPGGRHEL